MAPSKKKQKIAEANASDGEEDDLRYANSLPEALAASNLLHAVTGAGGLRTRFHVVGEKAGVDEVDVLRAVATAEAAVQPPRVKAKDRKHPLAEWPLVQNKDKLGGGAPDDFLDGHLPEAAETWRKLRWTPQQWVVYLQARRQQQLKHPSRPKCCFCLSMLTYISGCPLIRALMRQAYGPMWLADGDCVLVNRLLMEAIADRAVLALMKEGDGKEQWDRTTVVNVRTDDGKGVARFVRQSPDNKGKNDSAQRKAADWAIQGSKENPKPDGVVKDIYKYSDGLQQRDHAARIWADVAAMATREGGLVDGGVEFPGDDVVFTASNVEDTKDVSLALLEAGSASKKGRLQLLVPVWCSVLKCMITMRVFLGRKSVDAVSEPSVEATTDMREAVVRMKDAEGSDRAIRKVYEETKLIYTHKKPASNGPNSWMVANGTYTQESAGKLSSDLDDAFGHAERMSELAHDALERVVERLGTLDQLTRFCTNKDDADRVKALIAAASEKVRGSVPKTIPSAFFDNDMVNDFGAFADAVVDELNLTGLGCWSGSSGGKGGKGKKGSSGGAAKPASGGKRSAPPAPTGPRSKKPAAKRPKKTGPSSSSSSRRETSPERQQRLNERHRVSANADPRAQEKGAAAAKAGRRKR